MELVRALGGASSVLLLALTGAAQTTSDEFIAYNRCAPTGIGSQGTALGTNAELNGDIALDRAGEVVSLRFTFGHPLAPPVPLTRKVEAAWLYVSRSGTAPNLVYTVRLCASDALGLPGAALTAPAAFSAAAGGPRWLRVAFAAPAGVDPGQVLHLLIEHASGPASANEHLVVHSSRSRHPLSFLPCDLFEAVDERTPADRELAVLVVEPCGELAIKQAAALCYAPVFLIEHTDFPASTDRRLFGNPYNRHDELEVFGERVYGQRLVFQSSGVQFDYAAMFTGAATTHRPCGDLWVEVYEEQAGGPPLLAARGRLISGECQPGQSVSTSGSRRWHWYGAYLDATVTVVPGRAYYVMLAAPDCGVHSGGGTTAPFCDCAVAVGAESWDRWILPLDGNAGMLGGAGFPFGAGDIPTYLRASSYVVQGRRDASSPPLVRLVNISIYGQTPTFDTGFVLGAIAEPGRPVALNDEVTGLSCGGTDLRFAEPGSPVQVYPILRNMGGEAFDGELVVQIEGPGIFDCKTLRYSLWNSDAALACADCADPPGAGCTLGELATLEFVMPDDDVVRCELGFGVRDASGMVRIDERTLLEIRRAAPGSTCCP